MMMKNEKEGNEKGTGVLRQQAINALIQFDFSIEHILCSTDTLKQVRGGISPETNSSQVLCAFSIR